MAKSVIGSAGDYYVQPLFGNIHWTVGEIAVSRFDNELELGEGFHQTYFDLLVHLPTLAVDWEVKVFPNPTASHINIQIPEEEIITARLLAATGQLLQEHEQIQSSESFDLSLLPAGSYWLLLMNTKGQQQSFQIQKINH